MICVYKILSPDLKECYVGSSIDYKRRKSEHKKSNNSCFSRILFEKYGFDNCPFVILEQCIEEELLVKEQWWQDHSVGLVNKINAIGDREKWYENRKEWREENRDKYLEQKRIFYEKHKQKILEDCKQYREANKEKRAETQRKYRESKKLKSI